MLFVAILDEPFQNLVFGNLAVSVSSSRLKPCSVVVQVLQAVSNLVFQQSEHRHDKRKTEADADTTPLPDGSVVAAGRLGALSRAGSSSSQSQLCSCFGPTSTLLSCPPIRARARDA